MRGDPGGSGKAAETAQIHFSVMLQMHPVGIPLGDTSTFPFLCRFLDTSKQAIGMLFIHFANVYLSDLTEEDPCSL